MTMEEVSKQPLLCVRDLCKVYPLKQPFMDVLQRKPQKRLAAVNHVSFSVEKGQIFGLVGESGCGKSTLAKSIIHLEPPTSGEVEIDGVNITRLDRGALRRNCRNFQMIFQDPYSSLNPRMTVREILSEELRYHRICTPREMPNAVERLLNMVGLSPTVADRYPGEFSGGQRQRIGIARALAMRPKLIIADEPVSALDVSIQAQILNLLVELREKLDLTILFISHDLRVVEYITDRIAVMYLGEIVELADTEELYAHALHPYTQALLRAAPQLDPDAADDEQILQGELPSPIDLPDGCHFAARCPMACEACTRQTPVLREIQKGHWAACLRLKEGKEATV